MIDVAIIDYKMSNLFSVQAACENVGLTSVISSDADQILDAKVAILPGVGAFGESMMHLSKYKLDECIYKFIDTKRPLIGICLGLQLLFETSEEFGFHCGLGIIKGTVKKFDFSIEKNVKYPVPQVGWNKIFFNGKNLNNTLLRSNRDCDFMYFVHSYYVIPADDDIILTKTKYGNLEYCSSVQYKNIFATQFHPEKSGAVGIKLYKTLKEYIGK